MTDDALEALLESWSRWATGARVRHGHCGSAEGLYRPERVADDEQRQPTIRLYSLVEIQRCERAVVALPASYRLLVAYIWLRNWPPPMSMRRAKVQPLSRGCGWVYHRAQAFGLLRQNLA